MKQINKKKDDKDILSLRTMICAVILGQCAIIGTIALCLRNEVATLSDVQIKMPYAFLSFLTFELFTMIAIIAIIAFIKAVDSRAFNYAIDRLASKWSQRKLQQQAEETYYMLLSFIYDVIRKSNNVLLLPISDDASCLIPKGAHIIWINGQALYRFELQLNEKPVLPTANLRSRLMRAIHQVFRQFNLVPNALVTELYFDSQNSILVFEIKNVTKKEYYEYLKKKEMEKRI